MWICLNKAFLSIVEPNRAAKGAATQLLVRARRKGDIESVFPHAEVETIDGRDYMFRALVGRKIVADAIAAEVTGINYGNFKDSVRDHGLHDAYAGCWHVMAKVQPQRPYSRYSEARSRPAQRGFDLPDLVNSAVAGNTYRQPVESKPAPRKRAVKAPAA